jgi:polar amino acid transport system substrate-binding protein
VSGSRALYLPVITWALVALTACGTRADDVPGNPELDKLAQIRDRGTIVLSTDLDYAPQSFRVSDAVRAAETRCAADQLTAPEVSGFDAETGKAVAEGLGVEACFVAPQWVEITAGSWGERWDLAYGSGAIDAERNRVLYVTQPYYILPAYAFVPEDPPVRSVEELSGGRIGVCASCTHESYLKGTLSLPGYDGTQLITDAEIVAYTVEGPGLADTARGGIDAFICSEQVGERAIEDGLGLRKVGPVLFDEYATGWIDRSSELDVRAFIAEVDGIVQELHADGTLRELSIAFFGKDYATPMASFDIGSVEQGL